MNKNLLAVVATKITLQFVLKFAANNYFVCNISLDIFCVAGGGGRSYDYIYPILTACEVFFLAVTLPVRFL